MAQGEGITSWKRAASIPAARIILIALAWPVALYAMTMIGVRIAEWWMARPDGGAAISVGGSRSFLLAISVAPSIALVAVWAVARLVARPSTPS